MKVNRPKPIIKTIKFMDWIDSSRYLKQEYPKLNWSDFWRKYLCDSHNVSNGCHISIPNFNKNEESKEDSLEFGKDIYDILQVFSDEFGHYFDSEIQIYIWW